MLVRWCDATDMASRVSSRGSKVNIHNSNLDLVGFVDFVWRPLAPSIAWEKREEEGDAGAYVS
jgi:hypothetical protein